MLRTSLAPSAYCLTLAVLICSVSFPADAGTLDDLETSATKPKSSSQRSSSSTTYESSGDSDARSDLAADLTFSIFEFVFRVTGEVMGYGGESSGYRQQYQSPDHKTGLYRLPGDGLLPVARLEAHVLNASDGITGQQTRVQVGYGAVGFSHTQSRLFEETDSLTMSYQMLHYRMSFGNKVNWDLAFGSGSMIGDARYKGTVFASPVRVRLAPQWHVEYFPVWSSFNGGAMVEHQTSLNWQQQHWGAQVGFKKWVTDSVAVVGSFIGLSLTY